MIANKRHQNSQIETPQTNHSYSSISSQPSCLLCFPSFFSTPKRKHQDDPKTAVICFSPWIFKEGMQEINSLGGCLRLDSRDPPFVVAQHSNSQKEGTMCFLMTTFLISFFFSLAILQKIAGENATFDVFFLGKNVSPFFPISESVCQTSSIQAIWVSI